MAKSAGYLRAYRRDISRVAASAPRTRAEIDSAIDRVDQVRIKLNTMNGGRFTPDRGLTVRKLGLIRARNRFGRRRSR